MTLELGSIEWCWHVVLVLLSPVPFIVGLELGHPLQNNIGRERDRYSVSEQCDPSWVSLIPAFFFVPFLGLFLLWNQTEMLATQATAFPTGRFQYINMPENAVVSCLFYPSLLLSVRYTVSGEKRPVTHSELWNNSKR